MRTEPPAFSTSKVTLHQTLHGYDGGHRLIEASTDLPPATRRQMLLLSDLSGPEMDKEFDGYVTGYPLSEIKAYALARTWYANEMPRPGCVWTHTVLVPFSELEREYNVFDWLNLLRRPERGGTDSYRVHLPVTPQNTKNILAQCFGEQTKILLNSLYSYPNQSTIITATEASAWEESILSLWAYQWPRLRRNFTFCTGALSPRFFGDKPFDLQVAPALLSRTFSREPDRYRVLTTGSIVEHRPQERESRWLAIAMNGLNSEISDPTAAQKFCWKYGSDVRPDRSSFIPLIETFTDVERERSLVFGKTSSAHVAEHFKQLVDDVAERFPMPREARLLKSDMFGGTERNTLWNQGRWIEGEILQVLATTDRYASYEADVLRLMQRASAWTVEHPQQAAPLLQKLLRTFISPLGEAISSGILLALTPATAFTLAQDNPGLLPLFVETYPVLATVPTVWSGSASEQRAILDVIQRTSNPNWQQIADAVLTAGTGYVAREIMGHLGSSGTGTVLDWINKSDFSALERLQSEWQSLLSEEPDSLITWLNAHLEAKIEVVAYVSSLLDPHASNTLYLTDTTWYRLSGAIEVNKVPSNLHIQVATFLLSIALHNKGKYSARIATSVFQTVHDATAQNTLPHDAWRQIEPHLPHLGGLREWDKCEKLREALVTSFVKFEWPVSLLFSAIRNEYTFYRIVDFCRDDTHSRMFLKRLQKTSTSGIPDVRKFHREALKDKSLLRRLFD